MTFLINYMARTALLRLILGWVFEISFNALVRFATRLAKKTDNNLDDDLVAKLVENKKLIIDMVKKKD